MKALYLGYRYEFGQQDNGDALNFRAWHNALANLNYDVQGIFFDQKSPFVIYQELQKKIKETSIDLIFIAPQLDKFPAKLFETLLKTCQIKTIGFFGDDQWRYESFSKYYCSMFDLIVTTDFMAVDFYKKDGQPKVLLSQWGVPSDLTLDISKKPPKDFQYDVSFVGAKSRYRSWFVERLRSDGIKIECFGDLWENGRVTYDEMKRIANRSKISLNISNSAQHDIRYVCSSVKNFLAYIKNNFRKTSKNRSQTKARNFEIPGLGGMQLTDYVPGISEYWQIGSEISCYTDYDECLLLIKYFLNNEKEREKLRLAGNQKAISHHIYEMRIQEIVAKLYDT